MGVKVTGELSFTECDEFYIPFSTIVTQEEDFEKDKKSSKLIHNKPVRNYLKMTHLFSLEHKSKSILPTALHSVLQLYGNSINNIILPATLTVLKINECYVLL